MGVMLPSRYLGNGLLPAKNALESSLSGGALGVRAAGPPKGLPLSWKTTHIHQYTHALCTHGTRMHATRRPHLHIMCHTCVHTTHTPSTYTTYMYTITCTQSHAYLPQTGHRHIHTRITQIYMCHVYHTSHMFIYHMHQTHEHTTLHIPHACSTHTYPYISHVYTH